MTDESLMDIEYQLIKIKKLNQIKWTNIILIVLLIIGLIWTITEFRQMNKEGLACKSAPFNWGEQEALKVGLYCQHSCSTEMPNIIPPLLSFYSFLTFKVTTFTRFK